MREETNIRLLIILCCAVVNNDMHAVPVIHTTISSVYSTANIANGLISSPLN